MTNESATSGRPPAVDRATFQAELDKLRAREKAHTREGDAIAAARRRLPMVEVDASLTLTGPDGPVTLLDAFEGRRQLIAYYFMWCDGHPAAEQCEGCTWCATQVAELSYLHSRDITYAVFCQGPYDESVRYRDFMGWDMPWYSAQDSRDALLSPPRAPGLMHLVCYLRDGDRVFETYWTTRRGVEQMDNSYALMDLTAYGRQEAWEDSPPGWPRTHQHPPRRPPAVPAPPPGRSGPARARETAHTREGDAIAAARLRLPVVEVDATTPPIGGRDPERRHGYRDFMGWDMPWYSAAGLPRHAPDRAPDRPVPPVCYLRRRRTRVFETYVDQTPWRSRPWTTAYALTDPTRVPDRQEACARTHPPGWPQECDQHPHLDRRPAAPGRPVPEWPAGRPISQWPRLEAAITPTTSPPAPA